MGGKGGGDVVVVHVKEALDVAVQAVGGRCVGCLVVQLQGVARVGEVEAQVFFEDDLQRVVGLYPGKSGIVDFADGDGFVEDVGADTFEAVFVRPGLPVRPVRRSRCAVWPVRPGIGRSCFGRG